MQAIDWLIHVCMTISNHFYYVYLDISGWWTPFNLIAPVFLWVSDSFIDFAHYLGQFSAWVWWAQDWISKILTWDYILSLIMPYIQWGINAWNWVVNAWNNIWNEITIWWATIQTIVTGWIDVAKQWAKDLIDQVSIGLNYLSSAWTEFTTTVLPKLASWTGVGELITSYLENWFPWYNTLVEIKDELFEFFADPIDYVYNKMDEFFERWW